MHRKQQACNVYRNSLTRENIHVKGIGKELEESPKLVLLSHRLSEPGMEKAPCSENTDTLGTGHDRR